MELSISVKNLNKSLNNRQLLEDISVDFTKGQIHGIIGRNGAGKTLLMKAITGLMYFDSGEIQVEGKVISSGSHNIMLDNIGIIIESPGFLPQLSGYKNLEYLAGIRNKIGREEIEKALEIVGLKEASSKLVSQYSMGMRQRLAIAQAFMEGQNILVLDEPMNGLDNQGVTDMRELFMKLKKEGRTILLASHNREDIEILCDSVIELDHGKIISRSE